jgi:hypothetical protein
MDVTCSTWVNSVGLVLDICGAILLWKYGLPEAISREGHQYIVLGQKDKAEAEKAQTYDRWSKLGLGLLIFGFVLQFVSNLI